MTVSIAAFFILSISGIGYAGTTWPPSTLGLKSKLSCSKQYCAVLTAGKGQLNIECAQATPAGSWDNPKSFTCPTVGSKQVCTEKTSRKTVNLNPYDTDAVKCNLTCGPCTGGFK